MRTTIGSAVRRDGHGLFLTIAALALGLLCPAAADASPPISAALMGGVVGQAQYGTDQGTAGLGRRRGTAAQGARGEGEGREGSRTFARSARRSTRASW